jgi:N-acetylglutamate synthase
VRAGDDSDDALIAACEERIVNCWPALETMLIGDWVVRFAKGYSGRANAATAIRPGAGMDGKTLAHIVGLYRAAGITPRIRMTPLVDPGFAAALAKAGWRNDSVSNGMIRESGRFAAAPNPRLVIAPGPESQWIEGVCARQPPGKQDRETFRAMMGALRVTAGFATIHHDGRAVGFALGAVDRGYLEIGSVIIDAASRGQGLGRAIVSGLLAWGGAQGASRAFLQVDAANAAAIALYRSLGYRDLYRYDQFVLTVA